ncbi:MAG: hypothetical protein ACYC4U_32140 [Pirellulaceae bacterium]
MSHIRHDHRNCLAGILAGAASAVAMLGCSQQSAPTIPEHQASEKAVSSPATNDPLVVVASMTPFSNDFEGKVREILTMQWQSSGTALAPVRTSTGPVLA